MRVHVAGCDRTGDLGREISERAERLAAARDWSSLLRDEVSGTSALSLRRCQDEKEFLDRLASLMWARGELDTRNFYIPRRPGPLAAVVAGVKSILWKVLRYQHQRMAFQQNAVNTQLTAAIEFIRAEYRRELSRLEERLERMSGK